MTTQPMADRGPARLDNGLIGSAVMAILGRRLPIIEARMSSSELRWRRDPIADQHLAQEGHLGYR
jgi:hypothetical protein